MPLLAALLSRMAARVSKSEALRRGRFYGNRQAPTQARLQARLQILHFLGKAVAGQDDLLLAIEQRIEGMEELFLGGVLAGEKLDVIDQQRIDRAEATLELIHVLGAQGIDHAADKLLGAQVKHLAGGIVLAHQVAGGVHQVGLAQAGAAIQQQGVEGTPRIGGDLDGGGLAQFVAAERRASARQPRGYEAGSARSRLPACIRWERTT